MKKGSTMTKLFQGVVLTALLHTTAFAQTKPAPFTGSMKSTMRAQVIPAARHAWTGYKQYAWGTSILKPVRVRIP